MIGHHEWVPNAAEQTAGLQALLILATPPGEVREGDLHGHPVSHRRVGGGRGRGGHRGDIRAGVPVPVATWERPRGSLADSYPIPVVELHRGHVRRYVAVAVVLCSAGVARHALFVWTFSHYRPLMVAWTAVFAFSCVQWLLAWRDRPWTVTPAQQAKLDRLRVTVNVPVKDEDEAIVDRALYALLGQTRPVQVVHVVDDGSARISYDALREHWERVWPCGTRVEWIRKVNGGKKSAQAVTFADAAGADIVVTLDSDTALAENAVAEGLKPFAHRTVQSVAGIELAFNSGVNWLTRTVSARSLFFQLVACGAQSACGDILVNRGAFALYRAEMLARIVPAYLEETFLGLGPVKLGDDAALTLFARGRGRAVQQCTAFALTMYPETLSHHFRQWIRWMRGSTIRNCWRVRYLPVWSYGWWFTVLGLYTFLASMALPVVVAVTWPGSADFSEGALAAMLVWAYLTALRILSVRRSDENWAYRVGTLMSYAPAMLWAAFVLRPLRVFGMVTYWKQDWTTRRSGAEVTITAPAAPASSRVTA